MMELEEMKSLWGEMTLEMEKQKRLTDVLILKMTRLNFRSRLGSIIVPETLGSIGCMALVLYVLLHFQMLDTWYLKFCGAMTIIILILLPVFSLKSIHRFRAIRISDADYKQTLTEFSKARIQFLFFQRLGFYLGALLLVVSLPVMAKLIGNADVFKTTNLWMVYAIGFPLWYGFSKWVYNGYKKSALQAGQILNELEQ